MPGQSPMSLGLRTDIIVSLVSSLSLYCGVFFDKNDNVCINKIKPTGQLYERVSELGESGSAKCSTLFMHITH